MENENPTRSQYLEGKRELTDEDIIKILDLPNEKPSQASIQSYTRNSYMELKENPEKLAELTEELKSAEYLKYHDTYISKSKLLFEQSAVLYNEIPCLIILNEMKVPAYLLPYEYAKESDGVKKEFADSLKNDYFTDFKRVFSSRINSAFKKGIQQGRDIFFLVSNEKLDNEEIKRQLIDRVNYHDVADRSGTYIFFSEKDSKCYSFEVDKKGQIGESSDFDLKQFRLALSDKPLSLGEELDSSSSKTMVTDKQNDVNITNSVFESLLARGAIEEFKTHRDIGDRIERYTAALSKLEKLNELIVSEDLKVSNDTFIQNEKQSRFYQDVFAQNQIKQNIRGEKPMEQENENSISQRIRNSSARSIGNYRTRLEAMYDGKLNRVFTDEEIEKAIKNNFPESQRKEYDSAKEELVREIAKYMEENYPKPSDEYLYGTRKLEEMRRMVWENQVNKLYAFEHGISVSEIISIDESYIKKYSEKLRSELNAFENKQEQKMQHSSENQIVAEIGFADGEIRQYEDSKEFLKDLDAATKENAYDTNFRVYAESDELKRKAADVKLDNYDPIEASERMHNGYEWNDVEHEAVQFTQTAEGRRLLKEAENGRLTMLDARDILDAVEKNGMNLRYDPLLNSYVVDGWTAADGEKLDNYMVSMSELKRLAGIEILENSQQNQFQEKEIAQKSTESQNQILQESAKEKNSENQEAVENENVPVTTPFDPKAPIVYGETKLPAFAVMADGKLQSVENAVVEGFDKTKNAYMIDNGSEKIELPKATLETLLNDKREQEQIEAKRAEGRTIVFEDKSRGVKGTVIPEFAMYTAKGLETFKDFVPTGFNKAENSYTLSNGDRKITVTADRFKEITAPGRFENHFDENSPAWKKLCETQYNDFFQQRDNTAYNFRHNLSVYCRKEANSPCDAMHLAKSIIQRMPKEEQKKTEKLLDKMTHENESMAELITRIYHESIKEMPLNEDYMKKWQPKNVVARPFYDTISDNGKKIEDDPALVKGGIDRNLKIGDTIKNIDIQTGKIFGSGKDSVHFDSLKVVSASKEGNSVTLMDANKSYFKLPRDTVLQFYKEQQQREMKHEHRQNRSNSMTLGYI